MGVDGSVGGVGGWSYCVSDFIRLLSSPYPPHSSSLLVSMSVAMVTMSIGCPYTLRGEHTSKSPAMHNYG